MLQKYFRTLILDFKFLQGVSLFSVVDVCSVPIPYTEQFEMRSDEINSASIS